MIYSPVALHILVFLVPTGVDWLFQVKADCEPMLARINMPWPLNCSKLPESNSKQQLCMAPEVKVANQLPAPPLLDWSGDEDSADPAVYAFPLTTSKHSSTSHSPCPPKYVRYDNATCTDVCNPVCRDCVPSCGDLLFSKQHKRFAYAWMAIWASLCVFFTLITICVFCMDASRFRYPTRPVIFMAFCYLLYAAAHCIRLFIPAHDIICKADEENGSLLIVNGMESTLCIIIFLIQYYFSIASHIWWLVLTLTWYLAASRKWGLEAINAVACYFHLIAWAVPAVLTIAILVTGKVDSNELTGMCFVGNHDKWASLIYIIIPISFLLLLGEIFLLAGFAALLRVRTNLKTRIDNSNVHKLEKLMAKIGIFAILYTVPVVCVLGSYIHQSLNIDIWRCMSADAANQEMTDSVATVEIYMLQIFMSFVVGIMTVMWVAGGKTLRTCETKCCQSRRQPQHPKRLAYAVATHVDRSGPAQHYHFPVRHKTSSANRPSIHQQAASL